MAKINSNTFNEIILVGTGHMQNPRGSDPSSFGWFFAFT
jgi:hypothetical protein